MYVMTTKAKDGQSFSGPRLVVDGLEFPIPAYASVNVDAESVITAGCDVTVKFHAETAEVHDEPQATPTPAMLVAFATVNSEVISNALERLAVHRRRNELQPDENQRAMLAAYLDGLGDTIQAFQQAWANTMVAK
jgi:hypothetical protein